MTADSNHFDAIVIGAGQGGTPLARALAQSGQRVAIIERNHVGGTCVNVGCTPTKAMVASAEVAHTTRRAASYGVDTGSVTVQMERVTARAHDIVESFRGSTRSGLEGQANLDLIMGVAELTGPKQVRVTTSAGRVQLEADTIVLNTGQRPRIPPIDGLSETPYLTNETILRIDYLPDHLIVLGGGYVGLEFAQMFRRFGSDVTIVQRGPQIASREDADVADALTEILRQDGIDVLTSTEASQVHPSGAGVRVEADRDGDRVEIMGSHLLVATGRMPNTDELGLDAAGVQLDDRGHVVVDDLLKTNVDGVYAMGDVTGGAAFTHISYDDHRILRASLIEGAAKSTKDRTVPYTLFTDPQLGRVGMTERQARDQGFRVGVAAMPASHVARSIETGRTSGLWKAVVDLDTERILGAAILGTEGGEIAALLQVAILGDLPYTALRDGVFSHPTYAESLNNLFASVSEGD